MSSAMGGPAKASGSHRGATRRSVVVAVVLLAVLVPIAFYVEIAWNKAQMFVGVPSMTPVVVLFALTAAMGLPVLRRAGPGI